MKLTPDQKVIEAFKKLAGKACFGSGIEAWIMSTNDTMPAKDVADDIKTVAEKYDKDDALYQICFLMNRYGIAEKDISDRVDQLKERGWPEYKE